MIEWTDTARALFERYAARARQRVAASGADADEVVDDVRRHIEEEVSAARLPVVTEDEVRRILTRMGDPPVPETAERPAEPPENRIAPGGAAEKKRPGFVLLFFAVILPAITLGFEGFTGISAGTIFDPLPTWFHVALVALVPGVNLWMWRAGRARDARHARILGWLGGAAIGVCIYYFAAYSLFLPFAALGLLYFGAGLIPLAPALAMWATPLLRQTYRERIDKDRLVGGWRGALASLLILGALAAQSAATYYGLNQAASDNKEIKERGVRLLRAVGDRELLLRASYGLLHRELDLDIVRQIATGGSSVSADKAREVYYRVTGKPFNSVPPPGLYTRTGRWAVIDQEFSWDGELGGEAVGGCLRGLSLTGSRMDARAEPDSALVYCEWTLEFKNSARVRQEARAQIALPPGAVVSRLTLWVNGEEREAAFAGRTQTRAAYQKVAVVRRRDPVLVTTCGPDRILVQCFPVPPNGGSMKVKIGMTAPLLLETAESGWFVWPHLLERNFSVADDFNHALWIESSTPLTASVEGATPASSNTPKSFHCSISDRRLCESRQGIVVHRSSDVPAVWTPESSGQIILQRIQQTAAPRAEAVVFAIDSSASMETAVPEIADAIATMGDVAKVAVLAPQNSAQEQIVKLTSESRSAIRQKTLSIQTAGGQDDLPTLEKAWDLAAATEHGVVVWVHGPEAVRLSSMDGIHQRFDRAPGRVKLFEIQMGNGPDRLVEGLDGVAAVEHVPLVNGLKSDLTALLSRLTSGTSNFEIVRERVDPSEGTHAKQVGEHIERLWARDEVLRLAGGRKMDAAIQLAAAHQLVTPITGAVVLETREQFTENGFTPADPLTVPAIPEPRGENLIVMGIVIWAVYRCRKTSQVARVH